MQLEIISPDQNIFSGEAKAVQCPGIDGSFGILDNHAPLISALKKGQLKVTDSSNNVEHYDINGGVVEVLSNKVIILAE